MPGSLIPSDADDDASSWTHHRARVAALSRDREPDDPELQDARQRLKAARLKDHVRKTVAAWPPLDQSQLDAIAILLRPATPKSSPNGGEAA